MDIKSGFCRSLIPNEAGGGEPGFFSDAQAPHVWISGQWELHERGSLVRRLGLPSDPNSYNDRGLILAGYLRWGTCLPDHLEGQFSVAIWDDRQRTFFACRDHLGTLPFLYRSAGSRVYFAGDMRTLLRRTDAPRSLNARSILALSNSAVKRPVEGETFHEGIYSVPPGSCLIVDSAGSRVRRYWKPSIKPQLVPVADGDVFETARSLVEKAVANRIGSKGTVALLLSGGLDSSALAIVASDFARVNGRRLIALASVNDPANRNIPDERPWVEQLRSLDNLEIHYVESAGCGPFDGIEEPNLFETSPRIGMPHFYRPLIAAAESHGAELLLSGNFGEQTLSSRPSPFLLDLVARGEWRTLAHELRCSSSLSGSSPFRQLGSEILRCLGAKRQTERSVYLTKGFLRDIHLQEKPNTVTLDPRKQALLDVEEVLDRESLRSVVPAEFLMSLSQPYLDRNLLEFCLALPARFKARDGYRRYLLRRAFEHSLPARIAWRRGKMWASPDYYERFNGQIGKALDFVRAIRKSDPVREIVDVDALGKAIRPIVDMQYHREAFVRIPATMQLICFLRQFAAFRA